MWVFFLVEIHIRVKGRDKACFKNYTAPPGVWDEL